MSRYMKLPVEIEAIQWVETNIEEIKKFVGDDLIIDIYPVAWEAGAGPVIRTLKIKTLEGEMNISKNDYIIKGVNGEFYPCKPDIFVKTYKEVKMKSKDFIEKLSKCSYPNEYSKLFAESIYEILMEMEKKDK